MALAVEVEGLGKRYRLGEDFGRYLTLRESLSSWLRRSPDTAREIWALRDLSFTLEQGETLGVIGRNGAGKTTLLKVLSRITEPTTGVVRTRGRVGTLLDIGTGFHPELTGRENVYLGGAVLGMSTRKISRSFDEIVEFAGVARFLETPVKRYSEGMRLRLAFAVAAHLEPEILIVDEVLAVGDVAFQRRCVGKMEEVARHGRTVLFVSHTLAAIEGLCERALWVDRGRIRADGASGAVISEYVRSAVSSTTSRTWHDAQTAPGNEWVRLRAARVYPTDGNSSDVITIKTPFVLEFEYDNLDSGAYLNLSLHIYTSEGLLLLNAVPVREEEWFGRPFPSGRFRDRCYIPGELLNDGSYRVELLVVKNQSEVLYRDSTILEFDVRDVVDSPGVFEGQWGGVIRPPVRWRTEKLD